MAASPDPNGEWTTEEIMLSEVSDLNKRKVPIPSHNAPKGAKLFLLSSITLLLLNLTNLFTFSYHSGLCNPPISYFRRRSSNRSTRVISKSTNR